MIFYQKENFLYPFHIERNYYDNFDYLSHLHRDFELIYVIDGDIEITVDGRTEMIGTGEFSLILQNQIHSFRTPLYSKIWIVVFADDYARDFAQTVQNKIPASNHLILTGEDRAFVEKRLIYGSPNRLELISLFNYVAAKFMAGRDFAPKDILQNSLYHKIIAFTNDHFTENITLAGMARELGYEPHYLSRAFHLFFKMNFRRFVNEYRVRFAEEKIRDREGTLAGIALESGFQSVRNFNRVYKEITGKTPGNAG